MFQILSHDELTTHAMLRSQMHLARSQQFCDRHKWAVTTTPEGFEIDQFDAPGTRYLVTSDHGGHAASLRLRTARDGNMVEQAFPDLWAPHVHDLRDLPEVTRLCATPGLGGARRRLAVSRLLLGLCRHCRTDGHPTIFGLIFPTVARTLTRAGWAPEIIASQAHGNQTLLLARWTATAAVDWTLQESIEQLEDAEAGRHEGLIAVRAAA
jgi:N-acyl-L-homoserine lactone synthetase